MFANWIAHGQFEFRLQQLLAEGILYRSKRRQLIPANIQQEAVTSAGRQWDTKKDLFEDTCTAQLVFSHAQMAASLALESGSLAVLNVLSYLIPRRSPQLKKLKQIPPKQKDCSAKLYFFPLFFLIPFLCICRSDPCKGNKTEFAFFFSISWSNSLETFLPHFYYVLIALVA